MKSTVLLDFPQEHHEFPERIRIDKLFHVLLVGIVLVMKRVKILFELGTALCLFRKIISLQQIHALASADPLQRVAKQTVVLKGLPAPVRVH